jgi:hypothetical protein
MNLASFDGFDPTPYQRIPLVNLASMVVLARALLDARPALTGDAAAWLDKRVDRITALIAVIEAELTRRRRNLDTHARYGPPVEFDGGTDSLWVVLRDRLASFEAYLHPGFDMLIDNPYTPLGASLAEARPRAARARVLSTRLFGRDGLSFLRGSFRDQCETTGAILRMIEADGLIPELAELVGGDLITQLFLLQEQYELMVVDQLKTKPEIGENLRELRLRLARALTRYTTSVLDLLDEDEPESLTRVTTALRPMIRIRELMAGPRAVGAKLVAQVDDGEVEDPAFEAELAAELVGASAGDGEVAAVGSGALGG